MAGRDTVPESVESLVRRHEDERQIRGLIARLAHLADYGDLDEYMTLYTDDAVWEYGEELYDGADAIRADRVRRRGQATQGPGTSTRHLNTTLWVDVDGSDEAEAHSYWLFIRDSDTSPKVARNGRYHDTLRRTGGGWRMAHRRSILTDGGPLVP